MKGILLCGGEGTRLRPFTEVVNKHLVRVHNLPMAEYPLIKMIEAGIEDILIVTGGENFAAVVKYFGSGVKWDVRINYAIQDKAGGIAEALGLAQTFAGNDSVLVCLGDNIWSDSIKDHVDSFCGGACLFSIYSKTPERFGVLKYSNNQPIDILEKPVNPPSNNIIAGIYIYDNGVFNIIPKLKRSDRGELEITDINRHYLKAGNAKIVQLAGWWSDCGTIETILRTEELLKNDRSI